MIDVGETWSSPVYEVTDSDGVLTNAGTVTYVITLPNGTALPSASAANPATGQYTVDYLTTVEGTHGIVVTATGGVLGALTRRWSDSFTVEAYRGFISADDALSFMRAQRLITRAPDRETVREFCHRACSAIEDDLGQVVARRTVVEEHESCSVLVLRHHPAISITSIDVDGTASAADTYRLSTSTGLVQSLNGWTRTSWGVVTVTYVAGMLVVPPPIRDVALHVVARMWQTSQQMPHTSLDDSGGGGDFAALAELAALGRVDPVTWAAYKSYRMPGFA